MRLLSLNSLFRALLIPCLVLYWRMNFTTCGTMVWSESTFSTAWASSSGSSAAFFSEAFFSQQFSFRRFFSVIFCSILLPGISALFPYRFFTGSTGTGSSISGNGSSRICTLTNAGSAISSASTSAFGSLRHYRCCVLCLLFCASTCHRLCRFYRQILHALLFRTFRYFHCVFFGRRILFRLSVLSPQKIAGDPHGTPCAFQYTIRLVNPLSLVTIK